MPQQRRFTTEFEEEAVRMVEPAAGESDVTAELRRLWPENEILRQERHIGWNTPPRPHAKRTAELS